LLHYQLQRYADLGIQKVFIVVGHLGFDIIKSIGYGARWGLEIVYTEQERTLGIAHALGQIESKIEHPFIMSLGDIYFEADDLQPALELFSDPEIKGVLLSKHETDREMVKRNFTIKEDAAGYVTQVIEKPRYTESTTKGCGIYFFKQEIFDAIRRTPRTAMRDEYEITDSIQILINLGYKVRNQTLVKEDMNLTSAVDLLDLNLRLLAQNGDSVVVGEQSRIADNIKLTNCIVGRNCVLTGSGHLENCLVFSHTNIEIENHHHRTVFTPFEQIAVKCTIGFHNVDSNCCFPKCWCSNFSEVGHGL
jgi:dTDP-glucose pyrophosphorylase